MDLLARTSRIISNDFSTLAFYVVGIASLRHIFLQSTRRLIRQSHFKMTEHSRIRLSEQIWGFSVNLYLWTLEMVSSMRTNTSLAEQLGREFLCPPIMCNLSTNSGEAGHTESTKRPNSSMFFNLPYGSTKSLSSHYWKKSDQTSRLCSLTIF